MPTVELAQGEVHYGDDGAGPPLVLLHGLLVDATLWRDVVPRLRDRFRVVTPDLPLGSHRTALRPGADLTPHGLARLVADLLAALDLRDVTLVGNDTGGAIAQLVATRHGERLGRLVLSSCDLEEDFPPKAFKPLVAAGARVPGALRAIGESMRVPILHRSPLAYGWLMNRVDAELVERWTAPLRTDPGVRRDTRAVLAGIDPAVTVQAARDLARFARPTLWAWAGEDRFFSAERARRLAATMPDARFETVPGSRTFVPLDQPERLAGLVADVAAGAPVASASGG